MADSTTNIKPILEAIIFASDQPVSLSYLHDLLSAEDEAVSRDDVREALCVLKTESEARSVELLELASGFQYRVKTEFSPWLSRLWEEKPPRYTRALLETLSLIVYRQPITRAEIEEVRGVAVSANIIRTLIEREWVKIVGYKDVPGKPALLATTKQFLDYFNLKSLRDLPPLESLVNLDEAGEQLEIALSQQSSTEVMAVADHIETEFEPEAGLETQSEAVALVAEIE